MKRKKMLTAALCICMISALIITAAALTYRFTSSSGGVVSKIVNRVNIEVSATEFTFKNVDSDGMLSCVTRVSIAKTEPDFYGQLNSITLSGAEFGPIMYANKNNDEVLLPENVALTYDEPLEWEISFSVPYEEGKTEYNINLDFNYTTGIKTNVTQQYITTIPITITIV